jgi:hypothetical protein
MCYLMMGLQTLTDCKQISHIHNKQPLDVIEGFYISLYYNHHHNDMNQTNVLCLDYCSLKPEVRDFLKYV